MLRTLWGDKQRYADVYWKEFKKLGYYLTGDGARRDKDGYFWITGRLDDVLNVSGHRLGTAEVESALGSHPSVAEAAVVGRPDEIKCCSNDFSLRSKGAIPVKWILCAAAS